MLRHLARRLAGTVLALAAVSLITFVALADTPGDAASAIAGETASAAQLQALRAQMGLDAPLWTRYASFASGLVLRGDLGRSLVSGRAVGDLLAERFPYTAALALAAVALAGALGLPIGIAAALKAGSPLDTLLMGGAALGAAVPTFWSATLLILIFALRLRWLPVFGADSFSALILPVIALALPLASAVARFLRASLLDVLRADYVRTAHAKGLPPRRVLAHHVMRNSLIPVITLIGLQLGHLLGGAFIVESVFAWPGLGRLTVQAIFDRDYPVVLGATLTVAVIYLVINFLIDVGHGGLDP